MRIIKPSVAIVSSVDYAEVLRVLELAGRVCYKSENRIAGDSAEKFIASILRRKHEAIIEHFNITVRFICDRGVSHEIVRHRIASYAMESTRYCNYSKQKFGNELTFIDPCFWPDGDEKKAAWQSAMEAAEKSYLGLIAAGATAEQARSVLPNSLKTELIMTANLREWRHFLRLRTASDAHPQMREVANMLLAQFAEKYPLIFSDINHESEESGVRD